MTTWFNDPLRPTRDVDFLGFGDTSGDAILAAFKDICLIQEQDAVDFDIEALAVDQIRDKTAYGGLRVKTVASVDGARVAVVIDVAFGDAIEPGLEEVNLPVLLDFPSPRLRGYARETVIAEKFEALVNLGRANSRMKDFYDIWQLSRSYTFDSEKLARAIAATFARRKTDIPVELPDGLSGAFATAPAKQKQWGAFIDGLAGQPHSLAQVIEDLSRFLMPHAKDARNLSGR